MVARSAPVPCPVRFAGPWFCLLVICLSAASVRAQDAGSETILPWLDPATTRPLALRIQHEILIDRNAGTLLVETSRWQLDWLEIDIWEGRLRIAGDGQVRGGRSQSLGTTITLRRIELDEAMRFLLLPRSGEVRANISGRVRVEIEQGEWSRISIQARAAPGSVFVSRPLIKDLLANQYAGALTAEYIDQVLDQRWAGLKMIPFGAVTIDGVLTRDKLVIRFPLNNELLNLDINPIIPRELLWWTWEQLSRVLAGKLSQVDWSVFRDR